ncbi:aryl-alcohol oxidase precursor [Collybia nuda]|uniref:Aryl-alcohol oxidase n=1 Tax=Collybia nuda TaxID=64659 RepID=A0A9P6CEH5_9AGAR|nr:aryl-alcohol oxidase precursor [Collybia nuda]
MRSLNAWILSLSLAVPTFAALYTSPSQLPRTVYDYIVIGAGTAGSVVASRLTENPSISVLVLEAGVTNEGVLASIVPFLGPSLAPNTVYDWNYTTSAQSGYNGRTVPYPRGRMLGGSSSINYMAYTRGSSEDFDRYAAVTGDPGWAWGNMKQFMTKIEKLVPPADNHSTAGQLDPSVHSLNGAISVSLPGFPTALDDRIMATTRELPAEFPFNLDMNDGNVLGIGWFQGTLGGGKRSSAATAYLQSGQINRPNLHVLINAQVTKLVKTGIVSGLPSFRGVQFASQKGGTTTTVYGNKEVILSAGSIGTPTILQLSGIGPKAALKTVGITAIVDNPSVGQNLSDHALLVNTYNVKGSDSFDNLFRDSNTFSTSLSQWTSSLSGPFTDGIANHLAFLRLPSSASIFKTVKDPAPGPKSAHYEFIFSNLWVQPGIPVPATGGFMSITTCVISPTARGFTKISSSDPFAKPIIDPKFLSTPFDIFTMKEAVKAVQRFTSAKAWKDYILSPFGALATATTDTIIETYVRNNAGTVFHPTGTASMSPKGAKWGVVDPNLKVKGVEGLRIVDASIMPFIPNGHPQAPIYLIAERAAALIKS